MQLQKVISRKVLDKEYSKYQVVIPADLINILEWKEGEELEAKIEKGELVITKVLK